MTTDQRISNDIFLATRRSKFLTRLAVFGASECIWILIGVAIGVTIAAASTMPGSRTIFVSLVWSIMTFGATWGVTLGIEYFVRRPRPFQMPGHEPALIEMHWTAPSFPSGHATMAFALAAMLSGSAGMPWFFYLVATFISVSRVAVGVHYVSDVVVGALVGVVGVFVLGMIGSAALCLSVSGLCV